MSLIIQNFDIRDLEGDPKTKTSILISPPVYDTQYWSQWSQPYGLLRIGSLLKKHQYKRIELFDFMEVQPEKKIHQHRINPDEQYSEFENPTRPILPRKLFKQGDPTSLTLYQYHFGKTWNEFEKWLDDKEFTFDNCPDEVWISSGMTYWWEPIRDLIFRIRHRFGKKTKIILGGIYPTLAPDHAAKYTQSDLVVLGEIKEANDLWTDLSLYENSPNYSILTPSRGCPNNCAYCAQKVINAGRNKVEFRDPENIYAEMRFKWENFGIRDFAFYADFLLWDHDHQLIPLLELIAKTKDVYFRIYAPEGLDVRYLSQSQKLIDSLKAAHLQKIYLPCESVDEEYVKTFNRKHVNLSHFVKAVKMCEKSGFRLRNMDVNAFVLFGLPGESVDQVVKSIMFVSEIVGSIIPMLFTPVPSTQIYRQYLPFIQKRGWDQKLQMLNGKLFPFLEMNEGSVQDYVDMQRLMFTLNSHYRDNSFKLFGDSKVSYSVRDNVRNGFEGFIREYQKEPFE